MGSKLSKQAQVLILIGLLLVTGLVLSANGTLASVGGNLFEFGRGERDELKTKLTSTQAKVKAVQIEPLTAMKAKLELQIAQNKDQLEQVKAMLSQPINKTEIIGVLFATARVHNLEIMKMSLSGLADAQLGELPVSAVQLSIGVEGNELDLVAFIYELNTLYTYGAVDSAQITSQETQNGTKSQADVVLTVYTVQDR